MYLSPRAYIDALKAKKAKESAETVAESLDDPAEHMAADDPAMYQLILKKKRNQGLLKKMLADGGYPDLARMVSLKKERMEDDSND